MMAIAETKAVRGEGPEVETGGTNNLNTSAQRCTGLLTPRCAVHGSRLAPGRGKVTTQTSSIVNQQFWEHSHVSHASGGVPRWRNIAGGVSGLGRRRVDDASAR